MPLVLTKIYNITGDYTPTQLKYIKAMIDDFRLKMQDDDPEKNILLGKTLNYSDATVQHLLESALMDLNGGYPRTNYTLKNYHPVVDDDVIVQGAMIFALMREGILQLRNQIDYSESGLSIAMFNKTGMYQTWAGFLLQQYIQAKQDFKASVVPTSTNSGFVGINSEFGYRLTR